MLIALLAATVALVGPRAAWRSKSARTVIVLDRSASMGARDRGRCGSTRAADGEVELVDRTGDGEEIALVARRRRGGDRGGADANHGDIVDAVRGHREAGATGDNRNDALAFRLADGLCRIASARRRDRSDGGGLAAPHIECRVQSLPIGKDAGNLGITGLSSHALDGLGGYDIHIAIGSTHTTEQSRRSRSRPTAR